jgi:hypothetical protein
VVVYHVRIASEIILVVCPSGVYSEGGNHLVAEGINASGKLLMWKFSSAATGRADKQPNTFLRVGWMR